MTIHYLYLSLLLCLLSNPSLNAQEAIHDSVSLIKRSYIDVTVGKDKGKEVLLKRLSTIPPEKEVSDQNVIELQQLYPISPKEIEQLVSTIRTDGSWEDINYADTKRSGWEPKKHTERILKLTKYYYRLINPFENNNHVLWQFVSKDKKETVVCGVRLHSEANPYIYLFYPQGLDADLHYEDIATGKVYTGAALMKAGLPLPLTTGDYQPIRFTFKAVEK